jgi:hypothetical protein
LISIAQREQNNCQFAFSWHSAFSPAAAAAPVRFRYKRRPVLAVNYFHFLSNPNFITFAGGPITLTMKLDRYPYYADSSFFDFEFESEGPKRKIRKIARFIKIRQNLYSFGFGDLDAQTGDISDTVVSNNGDGVKVLATVAHIVQDFTTVFIS